eukprot:CAMPEP_0198420996 /NCGR_PEP_ID=MMETSP1452-20131203/1325_1 /TAXON_ID=1181717 /ORGANISM="Synchroma pusillum, Strain CCMP3072" /LENGTH=84 /DNA_ID=CAMNT_0044141183 /DNA_START=58 /DNA_END=312 /DNA_ORIENTATION=+
METTEEFVKRLNAMERSAKEFLLILHTPMYSGNFMDRIHKPRPRRPLLASSEELGTPRAEANSLAACLDYAEEQVALKRAGVPL